MEPDRRFTCTPTPIPGVVVITRARSGDARGSFERLYCALELGESVGLRRPIVQINRSITRARGSVRGMHFQYPPHAETKLVTCLAGAILDVVVDLRRTSPTFLRWHGEILGADDDRTLLVPEGCAHGFQTLEADCSVLYFHTAAYRPESEGGVHPDDPAVGIEWPLPRTEISARDAARPFLTPGFEGVLP